MAFGIPYFELHYTNGYQVEEARHLMQMDLIMGGAKRMSRFLFVINFAY